MTKTTVEIELDEDLYNSIVRIVQNTETFNTISEFVNEALREYMEKYTEYT